MPALPPFPSTARDALTVVGRLCFVHAWRVPLAAAMGIDRRTMTALMTRDLPMTPELLDALRAALHRHAVDCIRVRDAIPQEQLDFLEVCDDTSVLREVVGEAGGEGAEVIDLSSRRRAG